MNEQDEEYTSRADEMVSLCCVISSWWMSERAQVYSSTGFACYCHFLVCFFYQMTFLFFRFFLQDKDIYFFVCFLSSVFVWYPYAVEKPELELVA